MNKKILAEKLKEKFALPSQKVAEEMVTFMFTEAAEALSSGDVVDIHSFGKFQVIEKAERTGRNPKTGEEIKIAAKKAIKFKAGKALTDKVNQ